MLKKLLILLCLGAFFVVATAAGCGKKEEKTNGEKDKPAPTEPE